MPTDLVGVTELISSGLSDSVRLAGWWGASVAGRESRFVTDAPSPLEKSIGLSVLLGSREACDSVIGTDVSQPPSESPIPMPSNPIPTDAHDTAAFNAGFKHVHA